MTRELLECVFEYWSEIVTGTSKKGALNTLRRMSSTLRHGAAAAERKKVTFQCSIGGCGQALVRTARKGKGMFAVFERAAEPDMPADQFLVYKSTVAQDVISYLLDDISTGHLLVHRSGLPWSMKSQVVKDTLGFQEGGKPLRELFSSKFGDTLAS
jgi:hypothetical protein